LEKLLFISAKENILVQAQENTTAWRVGCGLQGDG
jgi:hypothetical protein